ncbi:MAG: hypothetical protein Kow0010_16180 [Dehalococcoidia bacterium]
MRRVLVIVPEGAVDEAEERARADVSLLELYFAAYNAARSVADELRSDFDAAVLMTDAVPPADADVVAKAVKRAARPVIEVQGRRWDGMESSPISAACRGVISGFGVDGVVAAVRLLEQDAAAGR